MLATPLATEAQPVAKAARIGVLLNARWPPVEAFPLALRERGWIEGQTLTIDWRSAEGPFERHPALAAELVRLKPDVIVTGSNRAVIATRQATGTIPIVFVGAFDPVGAGFVATLAKPAGNITGLSLDVTPQEAARDLALLREAAPRASRVAVIRNPPTPGAMPYWREMQAAAPALRVTLQSVEVAKADDLDTAFAAIIRERAEALYVRVDALIYTHRSRLLDFAARRRLPTPR
jgi:putative ABC transport system substrate-binding protein